MDVAVLGAGRTGREIAQICALAGHGVSLYADDATAVMDGIDAIERRLDDAVAAGESDRGTVVATLERLEGTTGVEAAVADADVVVETTTDDASAVQRRFATVEEHALRETLVATSRPTVRVTTAAAGLRHPDRALGLQFHRPLTSPLVEVVVAEQTTRSATDRALSFADDLDAVAVTVGDMPGHAVTRLGLALEAEAMRMVADGVAGVDTVDETLRQGYDHPVGPLEQADRAGLDDRLEALEALADALGPRFAPPQLLRDRVTAGATGSDTGEGFYVWEGNEPAEPALPAPALSRDDDGLDDPAHE
jgi:3-hydroxybutyryl-CoA dehydrogenase